MRKTFRPAVLAIALGAMALPALAEVSFSGFLSAGGGRIDNRNYSYAGYGDKDFSFDADTLFGLQVSAPIADKLTATGQFVARGTEDYELDAEWAYLSYAFTDHLTGRIGRLRMPLYLYSDFVDVGYAYSWITPPFEVYYLPFNNIQGVDLVWTGSLGAFDLQLQGYFGALKDEFELNGSVLDTELSNQTGIALQVSRGWFTGRVGYHRATIDIQVDQFDQLAAAVTQTCGLLGCSYDTGRLRVEDDDATFKAIALSVDTGSFLAVAEQITFEVDTSPFSEDKRGYVMLGWRFGDVLLHFTHSRAEDEGVDLVTGIPNLPVPSVQGLRAVLAGAAAANVTELTANSVGVRWDFTASTAFKLELQDVEDEMANEDATVLKFAVQAVF